MLLELAWGYLYWLLPFSLMYAPLNGKKPSMVAGLSGFLPSISIISVCARFYDIDLSFRISNLGLLGVDMVVRSETAQSCPPIPLDLGGDRRYEPCHILLDFGSGPRRIGATAT
jgi:hypothetical protein